MRCITPQNKNKTAGEKEMEICAGPGIKHTTISKLEKTPLVYSFPSPPPLLFFPSCISHGLNLYDFYNNRYIQSKPSNTKRKIIDYNIVCPHRNLSLIYTYLSTYIHVLASLFFSNSFPFHFHFSSSLHILSLCLSFYIIPGACGFSSNALSAIFICMTLKHS
jgi:hypothetical protein